MTRPRILRALWPRTRISTHLLFLFLCISLIPCGLLTALTLLHLGPVAREVGAADPDGDLRRQDHAARDVHPRAAERHGRPGPVAVGHGGDPAPRRPAGGRAARFAGAGRGGAAGRRSSRASPRPTATRTPCCSTPTATRCSGSPPDLDPGPNLLTGPLRDSGLAEVFDRVRTLLQVDMSDYQVYPGRSEPAAFIAGPVYDPEGRIGGYLAMELGNQRGLPGLHRLQRTGRDRRDGGGQPRRRRDVVHLPVAARPGRDVPTARVRIGGGKVDRPCSGPCRASAATAR